MFCGFNEKFRGKGLTLRAATKAFCRFTIAFSRTKLAFSGKQEHDKIFQLTFRREKEAENHFRQALRRARRRLRLFQ